jgi:mannose-6-phosphate isomerase-like protein (cupin superfamily)
MRKTILLSLLAICLASTSLYAQRGAPRSTTPVVAKNHEDGLDPTPINPATDPNVGMFLNDWHNAKPRPLYGKLMMHDILTPLEGPDPQHPTKRGAVLTAITYISYATLDPGATAAGRVQAGQRQSFYATGGNGQITVNGKTSPVRDGTGFLLTPDFDFKMVSSGKEPLSFYVRTEPIPEGTAPTPEIAVTNRFENVAPRNGPGAHWTMMGGGGGAPGLSLITMVPRTMPQPHSHAGEECWIMVKGETLLSLGKTFQKMTAGQAYKIPPTGLAAHSNLNLSDEPVEMIFLGPAARAGAAPAVSTMDYARLDNNAYNRELEPDVDMFMGNWRDSFPKAVHGNLMIRDMLTALEGPDRLHPTRRGAVLTNAEAVSYAMLEPGNSAKSFEGELKGVQETFVVNSGTGVITSGSKKVELAKDMAFVITPGLEFKLTNTGDKFMTFYVVTEKVGASPATTLQVSDNRTKPQAMSSWVNHERQLIAKADGLSQFSVNQVEQNGMTMSRPASAGKDVEEIWIATEGDTDILLGKMVRKLPAGTAYRVPSTGITAHANINSTGKTARFLYLVK